MSLSSNGAAQIETQVENVISSDGRFVSKEMAAVLNEVAFLMPNWKWIALVVLFLFVFATRPIVQAILGRLKHARIFKSGSASYLDSVFSLNIENPLSWVIVLIIGIVGMDGIGLVPGLAKYVDLFLKILLAWHLIRLVYKGVDGMGVMVLRSTASTKLESQLIPFAIKTLKALTVVLGALIALQNFGVNVMSLLAGLGLGGLALALAAQDTAANIFGSVTILFDQPFKVGDWIKIGDTEGTVEEVGFRSTRIRTFYNSLVTIPNSVVAKERVDNRQERRRRRVQQTLGLSPKTPAAKIEDFCREIREALLKEGQIDRDVTVYFKDITKGSMDILVQFFLSHSTDAEEIALSQKYFLEIVALAEKIGVEFVSPA